MKQNNPIQISGLELEINYLPGESPLLKNVPFQLVNTSHTESCKLSLTQLTFIQNQKSENLENYKVYKLPGYEFVGNTFNVNPKDTLNILVTFPNRLLQNLNANMALEATFEYNKMQENIRVPIVLTQEMRKD